MKRIAFTWKEQKMANQKTVYKLEAMFELELSNQHGVGAIERLRDDLTAVLNMYKSSLNSMKVIVRQITEKSDMEAKVTNIFPPEIKNGDGFFGFDILLDGFDFGISRKILESLWGDEK